MRTWRLLLGLGVGVSSVGLWSARPVQAEEPAKPAGRTAKPAALFAAAASYGVGTNPDSVTVGDWNGDGKLDLATANDDNVSILLNTSQ